MTHFKATQLVINAAENAGYVAMRSISKTNFGTSEYVYIMPDMSYDGIKVRISDHSVTNINRINSEIHIAPDATNVEDIIVNNANFKYKRNEMFYLKEITVTKKAYNVQTKEISHNDVVTKEWVTKKGETMYEVTRTYNNRINAYFCVKTNRLYDYAN